MKGFEEKLCICQICSEKFTDAVFSQSHLLYYRKSRAIEIEGKGLKLNYIENTVNVNIPQGENNITILK